LRSSFNLILYDEDHTHDDTHTVKHTTRIPDDIEKVKVFSREYQLNQQLRGAGS